MNEFELASGQASNPDVLHHHELKPSDQRRFVKHVTSLLTAFEENSNPFLDDSDELFAIDTKKIASDDAVKTLRTGVQHGKDQLRTFVQERLIGRKKM